MASVLHVIAKSQWEFKQKRWHPDKTVRYVFNVYSLRGSKDIDFIITEAAWFRKDINEIIQNLIICNLCGPYENKTRMLRMEQLLYA